MHVTVDDGFFAVLDTGSGMDERCITDKLILPKISGKPDLAQQIGRFGIGFYTALRHLEHDFDTVTVQTRPRGSRHGFEILFYRNHGEIFFHTRSLPDTAELNDRLRALGRDSGTLVEVRSASVRADALRQRLRKYLRYLHSGRDLIVNGTPCNEDRHLVEVFAQDGFRVLVNPRGISGAVAVQVGDLIIESAGYAGRDPGGEMLITFPPDTGLSITRDAVEVTRDTFEFFRAWLATLKSPGQLNALYALCADFDRRQPDAPSFTDLLKTRAGEIVRERLAENPATRFYPDAPAISDVIPPNPDALFFHPELFQAGFTAHLAVPGEFTIGFGITNTGERGRVRAVLSPDMAPDEVCAYADRHGLVFINADLYRSRPTVVWQAFARIPGMDFRWETTGALLCVVGSIPPRRATISGSMIPTARRSSTAGILTGLIPCR